MEETLTVDKQGSNLKSRMAYAFGNVGQSAFYNALSTYFIVYVTSSLFAGVDKGIATKLIGIITSLVVIIRIAEIFIDPLLGNIRQHHRQHQHQVGPFQAVAAHRRYGLRIAARRGVHRPVRSGQCQHHLVHRAVRGGVHRA